MSPLSIFAVILGALCLFILVSCDKDGYKDTDFDHQNLPKSFP